MKHVSLLVTMFLIAIPVMATNYYVKNSGSDGEAGTSDATAWATLSKVNSVSLSAGDTIFFKAGNVWREELDVKAGNATARIVYTRYGSGANPKILGSNKEDTWVASGTTNVWQSNSTFSDPRTGGMGYPGQIFLLKNDSTTWGIYKNYTSGYTNLTASYNWTYNSSYIYLYSTTNPNTTWDSVEVAQREVCILADNTNGATMSYISFIGIDLHYSKVSGFRYGYPEEKGATDLTFYKCNIGYIGEKGGDAAYGIEAFHSNFLVDSCIFSDCGRRAISFNSYVTPSEGEECYVSNVEVKNSSFKRGQHTSSLDLAFAYGAGDTVTNVYFHNNLVDDSGIPWTSEDNTSNQLFVQVGDAYQNNIYIYNNIFKHATARNILLEGPDTIYIFNNDILGHNQHLTTAPYSNISDNTAGMVYYYGNIQYQDLKDYSVNGLDNYGFLVEHNEVTNRDYNLYYQVYPNASHRAFAGGTTGYYNISDWSDYKSSTGFGTHSPSPGDPLFTDFDGEDYSIDETSPAKYAGTPIAYGVPDEELDYYGNARDITTPSIGALEYGSTGHIPNDGGSDPGDPTPPTQGTLIIHGTTLIRHGTTLIIHE